MLNNLHSSIIVAENTFSSIDAWSRQASYDELVRLRNLCARLTTDVAAAQSPFNWRLKNFIRSPSEAGWQEMQSLVKNINTNVVHMLEALRIEAGDFVAEDIPTFRDLTLALEGRKNLISDIKRLRFPLDEAEIKQLQLLGKEYQKLVNGLAGIQDRLADYIVKRQLSIDKKERQEESMASANNHWKQNIITLVIVLGIILISFFVLDLSAAITFSFVLLILAPVLLAFTQNAQSIKGINLLKLYEVGLSQGLVAIKALPKFLLRSNPKSSSTNSGS